MLLKGVEGGDCPSNDYGNSILDHGKVMEISWKFVFEFLWEPCTRFAIFDIKFTRLIFENAC